MNENDEELIILLDDEDEEIEIITDDEVSQDEFMEETKVLPTFSEDEFEEASEEILVEDTLTLDFEDDDDDLEFSENDSATPSILINKFGGKILIGFGVLIAVFAIFVGVLALNKKTEIPDVDFNDVGNSVAKIGNIGEANIYAIIDAETARINEVSQAINNYDYDEADAETGVTTVELTLTTILKDLKIKFVNSKNKLIGNVPFSVTVTLPNGKSETWIDEDKDGVIYKSEIEGGLYSVKLNSLDGYDGYYDFNKANVESVSVKTQLDYKKVDVSNEIKKATDAVTKTEDTKKNETEVESKLTDTVTYLVSSKVPSGNGYTEIAKDTIANPEEKIKTTQEASIRRFFRLSSLGEGGAITESGEASSSSTEDEASAESRHTVHSFDGTPVPANEDGKHVYTCSADGCDEQSIESCSEKYVETKDGHHRKVCSKCERVLLEDEECELVYTANGNGTHTAKCSKDCGYTISETVCTYDEATKKCVCGNEKVVTVPAIDDLKITGTSEFVYSSTSETKSEATITASFTKKEGVTYAYAWSLDGDCISMPTSSNEESVTITPVKAGTATLKFTVTSTVEGVSQDTTAMFSITVTGSQISLDRTAKKALFIDETFTLTGTVTGGAKNTITWESGDANIATVEPSEDTKSCVIKGISEGTVTITATCTDDTAIKQEITFVICKHPKDDTATKLLDKEGNQVYVLEGDSYRAATYADYYKDVKFYQASAVSYKYNGWWTIDGKTYYFNADGEKLTGEQVILGAKYTFNSDGSLQNGTGLFGIDVSVWNGNIDWDKVAKSGVNYAIIRCGFRGSSLGGLYSDNKFETNIKNATAAGVRVGVYFFTQAVTEAEAVEEASMCLSMVSGYNLSYPIFIDVESSGGRADSISKETRTAVIKAFCKTIENSGYKAGVYANKNWLTNKFSPTELTNYSIWLAQYASQPSYNTTRYDIWQYSKSGKINGISGDVDLNLSYMGY